MHQPKLQDELIYPMPINTPALFEPITIYVSNLNSFKILNHQYIMHYVASGPIRLKSLDYLIGTQQIHILNKNNKLYDLLQFCYKTDNITIFAEP